MQLCLHCCNLHFDIRHSLPSSHFSFETSDCDDDVSTSAFSFDSEASSNSFDFGSSHTTSWSPGPSCTMRRKRKTQFSFDDIDDGFDENMMDSLDAAMAPIDTSGFKAPSMKSPNNSRLLSTVPTHFQDLAAAQDRTVSAPALSGHGQIRTKASIAHNRKQKLPTIATSTPSVPVFSVGASGATGGVARRKGRRRNLGLTLDCDAIQVGS